MAERPVLAVTGLDVAYGDLQILWGVALEVVPRSVTALIGSNGAGKTTLLRTISGLLRPRAGTIRLDGEPIESRA